MMRLVTIEQVVKNIVGENCRYKLNLPKKQFMVESDDPISQEDIDKICEDVMAFESLRSFDGKVVFFNYW